ncbi:MAG: hypothetical protein NTZ35_00215 [Ignavibacteriales bacterium]|nr:hypothetical protein [Ignavibacteriales bacterium]
MLTQQEIADGFKQHGEAKAGVLLHRFARVHDALYHAEKRLRKAEVALKAARAKLGPAEAAFEAAFAAFTGQADSKVSISKEGDE